MTSYVILISRALVAVLVLAWAEHMWAQTPLAIKDVGPSAAEIADLQKVLPSSAGGPTKFRGFIGMDSRGLPALENASSKTNTATKAPVARVMPVTNPELLAKYPPGTPVEVTISTANGLAKVDKAQIQTLASWDSLKTKLPADRFSALHEARSKLASAFAELDKSGGMGASENKQATKELQNFQIQTAKALDTEMHNPNSNPQDVEAICKLIKETRDASKAFYGRLDNYNPQVYQRIYQNSDSVALLARRFSGLPPSPPPAMGSGVLIGRNLLITCNHVVTPFEPKFTDLQVSFAYDGQSVSPTNQHGVEEKVLARGRVPAHASNPLDYALILLKPNSENKGAHELHTPAKLTTVEVVLDDPIYVIGHPLGRPRTVHDNAFVLFPYKVNEDGMKLLRATVCAETEGQPDRHTMLTAFMESYKPDGDGGFRFLSRRWDEHPAVGADCDTSSGDSGSPVFLRRTGRMCGILFRGQPDNEMFTNTPYRPGWRRHEEILPMGEILSDVAAQLGENWATTYGVDIE